MMLKEKVMLLAKEKEYKEAIDICID